MILCNRPRSRVAASEGGSIMARTTRKSWTKAAVGAATVGAMLIGSTPAMARDRYDDDGIGAGEIIAGAVVLGGLAAILASAGDRNDYRYRDRYRDPRNGYGYDYGRYGNGRSAVNRCVAAAERSASRYGRADVTQVTSTDSKRDGYKVQGRLDQSEAHTSDLQSLMRPSFAVFCLK